MSLCFFMIICVKIEYKIYIKLKLADYHFNTFESIIQRYL
jgi:hypothetical protein